MNDDRVGKICGPRHANAPEALFKAVAEKRVSYGAMSLYILLDWHRDRQTKRARPGLRGLSDLLGPSIPTIRKWRDELVTEGLLIIEKPDNPNHASNYHLRWAPCPKPTTSCATSLHACPCESSCATFEAMGRSACARAGFTSPVSDSEFQSEPIKTQEVAAKTPPPPTASNPEPKPKPGLSHVQQIALIVMRDWEAHNHVKASMAMRGKIFGGIKKLCRRWNVPTEWSVEHILTAWRCFLSDHAGKDWKFTWFLDTENYEREWHHAAIKKWENNAGRAPAPARDPYGI